MSWCPSVLRPGWAQLMGRGGAGRDGTHVARTTTASCAPSPTGSDSSQSRSLPIAAIRRIAPGWLARARTRTCPAAALEQASGSGVPGRQSRGRPGPAEPSRAGAAKRSSCAGRLAWPHLSACEWLRLRANGEASFFSRHLRTDGDRGCCFIEVGWVVTGGRRHKARWASHVRCS